MNLRTIGSRRSWLPVSLAAAATLMGALLLPASAPAAPKLRFQIDQKGDMILFGNTLGQDCRPGVPAPTVGTVGSCGDAASTNDRYTRRLRAKSGSIATSSSPPWSPRPR